MKNILFLFVFISLFRTSLFANEQEELFDTITQQVLNLKFSNNSDAQTFFLDRYAFLGMLIIQEQFSPQQIQLFFHRINFLSLPPNKKERILTGFLYQIARSPLNDKILTTYFVSLLTFYKEEKIYSSDFFIQQKMGPLVKRAKERRKQEIKERALHFSPCYNSLVRETPSEYLQRLMKQ